MTQLRNCEWDCHVKLAQQTVFSDTSRTCAEKLTANIDRITHHREIIVGVT
jgi:hypothetical protein